jgi:ABC-2 type transport system permease protein
VSTEAFPHESVPYEGLGRPIRGPRALTHDWRRFWHLTYNIARNEFKLKFFGSALGYVWQVMKPLLLFGVLYVFFVVISHVGSGGKPDERFYGVQLLGSIILFTFFAEATAGAVRSVVDRENLVRKIQFPRMVIPLSVVLLAFFNLMLNLIVVLIFALISGVHPMLSWLELPLILIVLIVFATGMAMLLASLFVSLRDIQPIWEVFSQILFYGSPVIIPVVEVRKKLLYEHPSALKTHLFHLYALNPLVAVFQQFRHAMVTHATPSAGATIGSWAGLLAPLAVVAAIFVLGFWVFNRTAPLVAENL